MITDINSEAQNEARDFQRWGFDIIPHRMVMKTGFETPDGKRVNMDYYKKYQVIIADYNREKDRATVEDTFAKLIKLVAEMDDESQRHVREGLSEEELAFFDMLTKENISKTDRERVKQASKGLRAILKVQLATMPAWTRNATTQADVKVLILDTLYTSLPRPPFTDDDAEGLAERLYGFVWQQSATAA